MPWMPGIPHDQGSCPQGTLNPVGVVAHRTYGSWNSDYSVGAGGSPPVGFHFLIGKADGRWVQFYETNTRCAHAGTNANGNDISVGIEVEGTNDQPMTPWQVDRVRDIVSWLKATHGIALAYRFSTAHNLRADYGYVPHSAVAGADHSDYWTPEDWERIAGPPEPEDDTVKPWIVNDGSSLWFSDLATYKTWIPDGAVADEAAQLGSATPFAGGGIVGPGWVRFLNRLPRVDQEPS